MVQQVLSAPGWHQYEAKLKRKDGTVIVANISLRSFLRYGAQEPSIEAFVEDMTELRASEESMRQALAEKELYQNAMEALEQAVLITEPDGKIREINRAFSIIYGYERDEVVGRDPHILNPGKSTYLELGYSEEEYDNLFRDLWESIKDSKRGTWKGTVVNRHKMGVLVWAELMINSIKDREGNILAYVGLPFDVSERRKKESISKIEMFATIADLSELRDNETGNHMRRVGVFAKLLATVYGLPKKYCEDIQVFAPMHDIGKVGISDSILRAERALTSEVFEEMKKHTTLGYNTVKGKKEFAMVSAITLHHHERWDGSGYPMAIAGEDIPLSARITALADVYDALRSERPYKRPWSHERAVQEIVSSSGTHFEPSLVEDFETLKDVFDRIYNGLGDHVKSESEPPDWQVKLELGDFTVPSP